MNANLYINKVYVFFCSNYGDVEVEMYMLKLCELGTEIVIRMSKFTPGIDDSSHGYSFTKGKHTGFTTLDVKQGTNNGSYTNALTKIMNSTVNNKVIGKLALDVKNHVSQASTIYDKNDDDFYVVNTNNFNDAYDSVLKYRMYS